jgi:hypothetical protein
VPNARKVVPVRIVGIAGVLVLLKIKLGQAIVGQDEIGFG